MTQEDKDLLLQDLCGRLPYGVKCKVWYNDKTLDIKSTGIDFYTNTVNLDIPGDDNAKVYVDNIKPYLFPLSSMTEEQKIECFKGTDIELDEYNEIWSTFPISNSDIALTNLNNWLKVINWLNKNHFDYRGLIEKDLAFDATGLNIY